MAHVHAGVHVDMLSQVAVQLHLQRSQLSRSGG